MKKIKIMVTGCGALLGQGIIRSIKNSNLNVYVIGLDVSPYAAGLYWVDEGHLVPLASDVTYLECILKLVDKLRPDVLLIGTDVELLKISKNKDLFEDLGCKVLVSPPSVIEIADDKFLTASFFARNGLPHPISTVEFSDLDAVIKNIGFPMIVKPRVGARSVGVYKVETRCSLATALQKLNNPVIQQCVGSDEAEYTASGIYFDGECRGVIVMKRELRDGNTYRAFVINDEFLADTVREWTNLIRPYGPINFQFRIDSDGFPKVFEINARFSGTTPLRALCGFNEVEMCLRKLVYDEPIQQPIIENKIILRHWSETVVTESELLKS